MRVIGVLAVGIVLSLGAAVHAQEEGEEDDGETVEGEAPKETAAPDALTKLTDRQRQLDQMEDQLAQERTQLSNEILEQFKDKIEIYNGRAYPKRDENNKRIPFPWQLKCSSVDFRTIHACPQLRFFDPSVRVYFDTGTDDPDEIDIFNDGNLNLAVDLASIYWPWRLGRAEYFDNWSWGPVVGAGIGAPASDSSDGTTQASGAPIVMFSGGMMLEYELDSGPSFAFEAGYTIGYSSDESLGDADDSAAYVGLRINVPLAEKKSLRAPQSVNQD
ncbi:MAG: hypothetical protein QNI96_14215 [Woeseiaceae bacterium]|nr:hypothetical protein [Woeseiaceae bacterium]